VNNRPLAVLVVLFFLIPAALISVRVGFLGYPLFPTAPGDSWDLFLEARLARSPAGQGALWAGLPVPRPGITVLEETFLSGTLPLGLTREGPNRFAVWAGPVGEEPERLAYSATVVVRPQARVRTSPVRLPPYPAGFEPADQAHYVVGVARPGIMGEPVLAYSKVEEATAMAKKHGGQVKSWAELQALPLSGH